MKPASWLPASVRHALRSGPGQHWVSSRTYRPPHPLLNAASRNFSTTRSTASMETDEIDPPSEIDPPPEIGINAAPEIKFPEEKLGEPTKTQPSKHVRVLPESRSYFTTQPAFTDGLLQLRKLLQKHISLPTVDPAEAPRVAWKSVQEYRAGIGEEVRAAKYARALLVLQRLNRIHPDIMPPAVVEGLKFYKRSFDPKLNVAKPTSIDRFGRALAVGRRKTSTARAWVVEGTGDVLVNGKPLTEVFGTHHDRESAIWALKATQRIDKYNVWALVNGGGTTGQAEALTLAVAKALLVHEPALKPALRRAGCITRDPRKVERKKPGHVKARKMPAWNPR